MTYIFNEILCFHNTWYNFDNDKNIFINIFYHWEFDPTGAALTTVHTIEGGTYPPPILFIFVGSVCVGVLIIKVSSRYCYNSFI
jgi:hypothetical protein